MSEEQVAVMKDNNDLTKVTVNKTKIKLFCGDSEQLETVEVAGRLTIPQTQAFIKENYGDNAFMVAKFNKKVELKVPTLQLFLMNVKGE